MGNIAILKATHHLGHCVHLTDMGQELIAQALALGGTLYKTCNIHKAHGSRHNFAGLEHIAQNIQAFIGNINNTHIGLDSAKGIIGSLSASLSNRIKQGALAHVRQAHNTNL